MANCVLCGKKVGMFEQVNLDFHGVNQVLCGACHDRLEHASPQEREALERQILDSPHLAEGELLRENLNTGKTCPVCGGALELRLRGLEIGRDGYGGLSSMGLPSYAVDLYTCSQCGRVELYTAGAGRAVPQPPQDEEVVCPVCGTRHSSIINCPACARRGGWKTPDQGGEAGRKKDRDPWEK